MKTATFVKRIDAERPGQTVMLWKLDPVEDGLEYVITSAVDLTWPLVDMLNTVLGAETASQETYIFAADKDGKITDLMDLPGSTKHIKDHEQAIRNAGWEVANG